MKRRMILPLLALGALAACDDDPTGTGETLTETEVAELSDVLVQSSFDVTGEIAADASVTTTDGTLELSNVPITSTIEFTLTRTCELGGQVVIEGARIRQWDRETWTGSSDLSVTKTHEGCARPLRNSDVVITLDGAPDIAVEAHHEWTAGHRHGLQTLTMLGAVDWSTGDGRSGTCEIDVEASFDPETHTRTVAGTFCNRTFERTTTWNHD
jgi:hypothetical protein